MPGPAPTHLPTSPLAALILRAATELAGGDRNGNGTVRLSRQVAARLNRKPRTVERQMFRILAGQRWLDWREADAWAVALGRHPADVWGWDLWAV